MLTTRPSGRRLHLLETGPDARLRDSHRRNVLAGDQLREILRLLLVGAPTQEHPLGLVVSVVREAGAGLRHLLAQDAKPELAQVEPAVLARQADSYEPFPAHRAEDFRRKRAGLLVRLDLAHDISRP